MEADPDEEEVEDAKIDDERERHWRMVFEDTEGGVHDKKVILSAKRWDIYMKNK